MIEKIDGLCFKNMVDYGIRNLNRHCKAINRLNVFPVPDGDTGTNMLTTISRGLGAVGESVSDLSAVSRKFAKSIVFEARGNSGVILSQFFKGFSEAFFDIDSADVATFVRALEKGVDSAYRAVSSPVEGTMLTVLKDATEAVRRNHNDGDSISGVMDTFLDNARISLDNTPTLLPVLKQAGVVDSGGAGVVCVFEGMKKYLDGDDIGETDYTPDTKIVDYSRFNEHSAFEYGYCTELLIQLTSGGAPFDYGRFKELLDGLGDSVATAFEDGKVRVHIHTFTPERVLEACHVYGEFLALKIENMSVQHSEETQRILCGSDKGEGAFSVVAVADDIALQKLFAQMGADAVIYCEDGVSTKDYLDAFDKVKNENIIVFPNSSDAKHPAILAKNLYKKGNVTVIRNKSCAECYAALPVIDFAQTDITAVTDVINRTISNMYVLSVTENSGRFYACAGKTVVAESDTLSETVLSAIDKTLEIQPFDVITAFCGKDTPDTFAQGIEEHLASVGAFAELFTVVTEKHVSKMTLSFE